MKQKWLKYLMYGAAFGLIAVLNPSIIYANENTPYIAEEETEDTAIHITTSNLRLRSEPSTESTTIQIVPRSTRVLVTDFRDGEWYAVSYNGTDGDMFSEFLYNISASCTGDVEMLEWSYVRTILPTNVPLQVTDVRTGSSYLISSFSNGNHADVEPVSAEDTAVMLSTYNGKWAWDTRPILIQVGEHTIAASINGMPHGGGVISGNDMNGQVCIHFLGSRTHNGSTSHERDHQNSVQEAFRSAA